MAEDISTPVARPEPYVADEAEAIAKLYRRLVLAVGGQLLLSLIANLMSATSNPGGGAAVVVGLLAIVILIAVIVAEVVIVGTAYKLARRLGSGTPVLWAVAMFIPCINILTLLALSSKATSWCRRHGIKVGLLGPTKESIEEIRRSSVTSAFD
ncbi:MAG TPA: hypothetical protein VII86_09020 [Thermoanaerobaculia bacterium]